ncbi:MAG: phosphate ABC transporter permease subunit PstC [Alphaproteobacteria bacterium]
MQTLFLATTILLLSTVAYYMGRMRAVALAGTAAQKLHSLPSYYGYYVALWCALPALMVAMLWLIIAPRVIEMLVISGLPPELAGLAPAKISLLLNDIKNVAAGRFFGSGADPAVAAAADRFHALGHTSSIGLTVATLTAAIAGFFIGERRVRPGLRARNQVETVVRTILIISSTIAVLTTIGIILSLLFESIRFFHFVPITDFLFGLRWSPQTAMRADQTASAGAFGAVPLISGTLLITVVAMAVAVPVGLFSAIYMSEYAAPKVRSVAKPCLEILAGVPTVVFGFFAAVTVAPFFRDLGMTLGLHIDSGSALAAGVTMGIMIIPFVSSLSDDVIAAVPRMLREGSLALGATKSETIRFVVLPSALPGIIGAVLLAISRAIGETMIVVMAAGLAANLTANPFEAVTTVTVQIVTLLVGDQEFDSAKTLSAFALGLLLFVMTLCLNVIALRVVQRYREQYE